jgi:hypothetical protein
LAAKRSSIPSDASTPTIVRTSNRRSIAADVHPVPQPTSRTRRYSPAGSDMISRSEPAMLCRTASS